MDKRSAIVTMLVGLVLGGILAVPSAYAAETEEKKPEPRLTNFKDWAQTDFAGRASVRVDDEGTVFLEKGDDMTGVTWKGPLIRMDYEITLDAKRVAGGDFFCGLTFPYGKDPCSLIVGGWGGTLVGLSSLDYNDAYNNETARFREFEENRWYRIRLRVTKTKIEAWIDDEQLVDVETTDRVIGIRWEVEKSVPLGIATWRTTGAIRKFKMEPLPEESVGPEEKAEE